MLKLPQVSFKICSCTALVTALLISLWWRLQSKRDATKNKEKPPNKWEKVGEVTKLTIYPLKSAKGTSLQRAEFSSLGLIDIGNPHLQLSDREFIVYDVEKKTAISGLIKSKILLMAISPENESLVKFSFPEEPDFYLQWPIQTSQVITLKRWWGETVSTVDCGEDIAQWVSKCLLKAPTGLRVGHFSQPTVPLRTVDNGWTQFAKVYPRLRSQYLGAYAYMASYLVITEESVAEVSRRLGRSISEQQFRANVTIKGAVAFTEDTWEWMRFGDNVILQNFKPCTRCAVTAISPDTGKVDPDLEPLRTLKKFRQLTTPEERELSGSEPMFGVYAGMYTSGYVSVGDPVYIGLD